MSITAEYFFDADMDLPVLAGKVNDWLGCSLAFEDGENIFSCEFFGMGLRLFTDHGFENDRELNFEDYPFVLINKTWSGPMRMAPIQVEAMGLTAFFLHRRFGIHRGILSFDSQVLLARYGLADGIWFDQVSQKPVRYPEHIVDVRARIPRVGWF